MTENVWADDRPPPGAGLKTLICTVVAVAKSEADIAARSSVGETYVVNLSAELYLTTEFTLKLEPKTVRLKPWSPTIFSLGLIDEVEGNGLETEKVRLGLDTPPPGVGLVTETL